MTQFGRKILEIVLAPRAVALHRLMIAEGQRFPELSQSIWRAGHSNATRLLGLWFEDRQIKRHFRTDISAEALAAQFISLGLRVTAQLKALSQEFSHCTRSEPQDCRMPLSSGRSCGFRRPYTSAKVRQSQL
ncbi:TetR/AcrR family transcriptional regulator C-terminal domain-containing protein [Agrobacterium vitis]|uniref:TetR/AcrR family transcriptional regulator C-terminal domain-containing protein n=1 Tax=Agrobacterium vitis TaxID=373 RepID=UPI0012E8D154|nr:TetR/AcrR family transcriptional regulator C-terminal domain-containing protein [Agrobacterium vitis]MUZ65059.1 hypothetical protein [Agrobacterium vitis]